MKEEEGYDEEGLEDKKGGLNKQEACDKSLSLAGRAKCCNQMKWEKQNPYIKR